MERSQPALGPGQGVPGPVYTPVTPQRLGRHGHCLPHTPAIPLSPKPVPGNSPGTMGPPVSPSLPRTGYTLLGLSGLRSRGVLRIDTRGHTVPAPTLVARAYWGRGGLKADVSMM